MEKRKPSASRSLLLNRDAIARNLFPTAHAALTPWEEFRWHLDRSGACDTHLPHSSQALAIDYFGTLKAIDTESRSAVLGHIAEHLGLSPNGPWQIELEWTDPDNLLGEATQTQVDAIAESPTSIILFEAKFGERDGGACTQTCSTKKGLIQCNGSYELQINPWNGIAGRCALSGKGIRYWDVIPNIMTFDPGQSYSPCPFAGSWYQWMRNMALAYTLATTAHKTSAVVIAYADHAALPFPKVLQSKNWANFVHAIREERMKLSTFSYQDLCQMAIENNPPSIQTLINLRAWIEQKIASFGNLCGLET